MDQHHTWYSGIVISSICVLWICCTCIFCRSKQNQRLFRNSDNRPQRGPCFRENFWWIRVNQLPTSLYIFLFQFLPFSMSSFSFSPSKHIAHQPFFSSLSLPSFSSLSSFPSASNEANNTFYCISSIPPLRPSSDLSCELAQPHRGKTWGEKPSNNKWKPSGRIPAVVRLITAGCYELAMSFIVSTTKLFSLVPAHIQLWGRSRKVRTFHK